MKEQIDRQTLRAILQAENIETLSFPELLRLFHQEEALRSFLPDGVCQIDPRDGARVLFNSARAQRPHDNLPRSSPDQAQACVVCQGHSTGVIDVVDLCEGFSFINKNLYPALYPFELDAATRSVNRAHSSADFCRNAYGLHFLQWTSSIHDRDWHNMLRADRVTVMGRLAALERKLLTDALEFLPAPEPEQRATGGRGFVLIFKNHGHLVGGSIAHGHQQIVLSNVLPKQIHDNWRFERTRGEKFSAHLMRENPAELLIRDYGPAALLVPYFMRRPYDMMLLIRDTHKRHLYQLTEAEIVAVAEGWHDAIRAIRWILPKIGREIAFNVVTHNGPGAGLYFEFLPYTQETGGLERLGILPSQGTPLSAASQIREYLQQ